MKAFERQRFGSDDFHEDILQNLEVLFDIMEGSERESVLVLLPEVEIMAPKISNVHKPNGETV